MKNEFKQYLLGKGMKSEEITVTINGAEKLDEVLFPIVLANMLGQASEGNDGVLVAMLMVLISRIAEALNEEPADFIMSLLETELLFKIERED